MAVTKNQAWNLTQGDGNQYATSSFTVDNNNYVKIHAHYLCGSDKIIVLEIDDAPECSDIDNLATVHCVISSDSPKLKLDEAGRYIVAREVGQIKGEIFAMNAYVTVRKYDK